MFISVDVYDSCRTESVRKFVDFFATDVPFRLFWQQNRLEGNTTCVIRIKLETQFENSVYTLGICAELEKLQLGDSALNIIISSHNKIDITRKPWTGKNLKVCHYDIIKHFCHMKHSTFSNINPNLIHLL